MLGEGRIQVRLFQNIGIFCSTTKMKQTLLCFKQSTKKKKNIKKIALSFLSFFIVLFYPGKLYDEKYFHVRGQSHLGFGTTVVLEVCTAICIHISRDSVKTKASRVNCNCVQCNTNRMLLVDSHKLASVLCAH